MGEMADWFLEQVMDMEELREDYRAGFMTDIEAYEAGIIDEQGHYLGYGVGYDRTRMCRYCGKRGLLWGRDGKRWRLFEVCDHSYHVHTCLKRR